MDWKSFDAQMKHLAKQTDCRQLCIQLGLAKGRVPSSPSRAIYIRCPHPEHEDKHPSCAVYKDGFRCQSCPAKSDFFDLVGLFDGLDFYGERLVKTLSYQGIDHESERQAFLNTRQLRSPVTSVSWKPVVLDGTQRPEVITRHELAAQIWQEAIYGLTLESEGATYLKSRGISPDLARSFGILEASYPQWSSRIKTLTSHHGRHTTMDVGLLNEEGHAHPYFDHFVIFPYMDGGVIETLRFRRIAPSTRYDGAKYLSLVQPPNASRLPYNGTMTGQSVRQTATPLLYIVEGEIDVLTMASIGRSAINDSSYTD